MELSQILALAIFLVMFVAIVWGTPVYSSIDRSLASYPHPFPGYHAQP
jgi:hypothetical protein